MYTGRRSVRAAGVLKRVNPPIAQVDGDVSTAVHAQGVIVACQPLWPKFAATAALAVVGQGQINRQAASLCPGNYSDGR